MSGYLQLIGYTLLLYLCAYVIIDRICKCIEHRSEWKYRSRVDTNWLDDQLGKRLNQNTTDGKEANKDVRSKGNSMQSL